MTFQISEMIYNIAMILLVLAGSFIVTKMIGRLVNKNKEK